MTRSDYDYAQGKHSIADASVILREGHKVAFRSFSSDFLLDKILEVVRDQQPLCVVSGMTSLYSYCQYR